MKRFGMNEVEQLKHIVRNPYAWPGGYEIYAVTADGGMVCNHCVKDNFKLMLRSTKYDRWDGQWALEAIETADWVEESTLCDNCYRELCPYLDD